MFSKIRQDIQGAPPVSTTPVVSFIPAVNLPPMSNDFSVQIFPEIYIEFSDTNSKFATGGWQKRQWSTMTTVSDYLYFKGKKP
jgi:hypothetical protein